MLEGLDTTSEDPADPQAGLTWVLGRIADHKINRIDELMPGKFAASRPDSSSPSIS